MKITHSLATITLAFACVISVGAQDMLQTYQRLIPPEILKRYDADIVAGKRPRFVTISEKMIWDLRTQPNQGGDVYNFNLDPSALSSVQIDVIREWIRNGGRVVLWGQESVAKYISMLHPDISVQLSVVKPMKLTDHPVNTDCRLVNFSHHTYNPSGRNWDSIVLRNTPDETEVIASNDTGLLAGRIPYGRGEIIVVMAGSGWDMGNDRFRWKLNFDHWALRMAVPGAAERANVGAGGAAIAGGVPRPDRILLKNGDSITGKIVTERFIVRTSYAELPFETKAVDSIILEGAGQNIEMLVLRTGDRLSGVLQNQSVEIEIQGGQKSAIAKDKIKEVSIFQE